MTKQGGKRPGAGRPKGARNKATLAREAGGRTLTDLARERTSLALGVLTTVATDADAPAAARVSAACALLDRGYGRPAARVEIDDDPPPAAADVVLSGLIAPGDSGFEELEAC